MKLNASASWAGNPRGGRGVISIGSGSLSQSQYFAIDDEEENRTNPYELLAAVHAACFSMILANELASAGFTPRRIDTTATITMERLPVGWTITDVQLDVLAAAPRAKQSDFIKAAVRAKTNCTISRLLRTNISMSAKLDNSENCSALTVPVSHG